jgi:glycosyltransferase involved in cell wall biosynthesis
MMEVLFDHQVFSTQRFGGVSRYFVEMARAMQCMPGIKAKLFAPAYLNNYIAPGDPLHPLSFRMESPARGVYRRPAALKPLLWLATQLARPQILHETGFGNKPWTLPAGTCRVTTLHDMTVERFPQYFDNPSGRMAAKLASLRRADAIVCISECTRQDLLSFYPEFEARCAVVHHGVAQDRVQGERPGVLPERYVLYVGTRQTYKNFGNFLRSLGAARGLPQDLKLVCFGGGPLNAAEKALCDEVGWPASRVVQLHGDDALLARAYRHAELFVFPSTYEGFGMPLTEAMVQGCPIACARATSFPEVCEDSAAYFDPADVGDMSSCIEDLVLQPQRRAALADAALKQGARFTWARCAEATFQVYRDALAARGSSR